MYARFPGVVEYDTSNDILHNILLQAFASKFLNHCKMEMLWLSLLPRESVGVIAGINAKAEAIFLRFFITTGSVSVKIACAFQFYPKE